MEISRYTKFYLVALALITVAGCAAPYQEDSLVRELLLVNLGGYSTTQIDEVRFKVEYSASPPTPDETIVKYIQYRCSTLALEKGFDGFSYEIPITKYPQRPQTKKYFYAQVILRKKPYSQNIPVIDAREKRDELEAFIKAS